MSTHEQGQHPAGRRSAGQAAELRGDPGRAGREPDQGQLGPRGARAPAQDRHRRRLDGRLHARAGRLRAGGDDPRASALPEDRDHLRLRRPTHRPRPPARLRDGRGRLRAGAGRPGDPARQGQGLRRALSARPGSSRASTRSWSGAWPSAQPSSRRRPTQLRESEERLRLASEAAEFGTYDYKAAAGQDLLVAPSAADRRHGRGCAADIGDRARLRASRAPRDGATAHAGRSRAEGPSRARVQDRPAPTARCAGCWIAGKPCHGKGADPARVIGTMLDITERKVTEERQRLLMAELDHRVKNILSNVGAVAHLSSHRATSVEPSSKLSMAASKRCRAPTRCCDAARGRASLPTYIGSLVAVPIAVRDQHPDRR